MSPIGFEYFKRSVGRVGGLLGGNVEAVTLGATASTLAADGVSFVTYGTSGSANDMILPDAPQAGLVKWICLANNTTSIEANLNLATTARVFFGTTFNTVTINSTGDGPYYLGFVAQNSTSWGVFTVSQPSTLSTAVNTEDWLFSATTGSTAQS